MNKEKLQKDIDSFWDDEILPTLIEYIKIPNKSPAFDSNWEKAGHMEKVLQLAKSWVEKHKPDCSILHINRINNRTPLLMLEVPGDRDGNILMYGHLDKQPEMEGWKDGYGPWSPVMKGEKLYGRGGADDGYALFASLGIIKSLMEQGASLPRIIILIEFCEESGSPDLPYYIKECQEIIGPVDLVVCLDSGAGNYKQFWTTVSLRGMIACELRVDVLNEGIHSGSASGLVPSSFRIIRQLLSRLEDELTGEIKVKSLHSDVPEHRLNEIEKMVNTLDDEKDTMPWHNKMQPASDSPIDGSILRTWKPTLSIVGADGIPSVADGGNVLRPYTTLKLSFRLPPDVDCNKAMDDVEKTLLKDPPYNASISIDWEEPAN